MPVLDGKTPVSMLNFGDLVRIVSDVYRHRRSRRAAGQRYEPRSIPELDSRAEQLSTCIRDPGLDLSPGHIVRLSVHAYGPAVVSARV